MIDFDLDPTVRPADDLFRHVNGRWLAAAQIPDDQSATGAFLDLRDASEAAIHAILTDPALAKTKPAQLFGSFVDEARAEELGATPIAARLAAIDALSDVASLLAYLGESKRHGIDSLIEVEVEADPGNPHRYVLFVAQGGLGLPDEAYYRLPEHADILSAYRTHVRRSFALAGLDPEAADLVVDLETRIAAAHWDNVRTRDIQQMYNLMPVAEFDSGAGWGAVLGALGASAVTDVVVCQPSFFTNVAQLLTAQDLPAWKWWARWKAISAASPMLSNPFVEADFAFYGTVLAGIPKLKERWKRGVRLVEQNLGEEVGRIYVERHFPPSAKTRMDDLVAHLVEAYRNSITGLDWMTEATKAEALEKLARFTPKIGYPTKWRDYSGLEVVPGDLWGTLERASAFDVDYQLGKVDGPIQPHEWLMTPQTVNAYYHPFRNEIVFPAAILQPPFFDPDADDAVNYGAIGAIIGHEIGHGFDDQGSTCDGDGAIRDWWTPEDRAAFKARTKSLIDQYDVLEPAQLTGRHVNGELTIGENIGDLGGLSIAYQAWRLAIGDGEPASIDGHTGARRFFLSWARSWQLKRRDEALKQQLATDPHAPEEFRCNQVVRNLPEFYAAFSVTSSDALWLDEDQRVKIW